MLKVLRETVQDPRVMKYRGTFDDSGIQKSAFADLIVAATVSTGCDETQVATNYPNVHQLCMGSHITGVSTTRRR